MIGVKQQQEGEDEEEQSKKKFKRPRLLNHQFFLERQNILLLSTRGSSTDEVLQAQESKISKFSAFLDTIETNLNCTRTDNSIDKILIEGIEMLLRAVKVIKSATASKQNLLLKLYKFKLKIILNNSLGQEALEECFEECLNYSNVKSIETFEEYYGIHSQLDSLIGVKILEFTGNFSLQEKIKTCLNLKRKGGGRGNRNILRELMRTIFHELKGETPLIDSNTICLCLDMFDEDEDDIEALPEYLTIIYNSNRLEFLENTRIFGKFLKTLCKLRESPNFSSIITGFNSKIRSFLNRQEAKKDGVIENCTKFVIEFYDLGIGCIGQFADFILKCQLMKLEDCCALTRRRIYRLLEIHLKKSGKRLEEMKFHESLKNLNLKYEFVQEMIDNLDKTGFKGDYFILTIYSEFLDENYFNLLEKYLKRFKICYNCFDEEFDDFFLNFSENEENIEKQSITDDSPFPIIDLELELVNFLFFLYPNYIKKFKGPIESLSDQFIKILTVILGILLEFNKVTWSDLSGTFGPNSASSSSFRWENRAYFCKIYSLWLKMGMKPNLKSTLKSVLNPRNSAEFWLKCLLDFNNYGQIEFFNEYYNTFFINRIECFKVINAPGKFILDLLLKTVDFKSDHLSIDFWNYLLEIASYLIELNPNLKGPISAIYSKNLNISDLNLIIKFYEILSISSNSNNSSSNLLIRHVLLDKKSFYFPFIQFLKSLNYSSFLLMEIFYEFLMSESREREVFIIQLTLCQICGQVFDQEQEVIEGFMFNFNRRIFDYCKTGNWDLLYKSLIINTLTKTLPVKVKEIFEILCEICNLDRNEVKIRIKDDSFYEKESNCSFNNFNNFELRGRNVYFKNDFIVLTSKITAFNCLTQLLKLLEPIYYEEVGYFIDYIRKRRENELNELNDLYFNLTFIY